MTKFEDHLWREVARQQGPHLERAGRPPAQHGRLRPRVLAGGSLLALAGVGATALIRLCKPPALRAVMMPANGAVICS